MLSIAIEDGEPVVHIEDHCGDKFKAMDLGDVISIGPLDEDNHCGGAFMHLERPDAGRLARLLLGFEKTGDLSEALGIFDEGPADPAARRDIHDRLDDIDDTARRNEGVLAQQCGRLDVIAKRVATVEEHVAAVESLAGSRDELNNRTLRIEQGIANRLASLEGLRRQADHEAVEMDRRITALEEVVLAPTEADRLEAIVDRVESLERYSARCVNDLRKLQDEVRRLSGDKRPGGEPRPTLNPGVIHLIDAIEQAELSRQFRQAFAAPTETIQATTAQF